MGKKIGMFIADKKFVLSLLVILILGQVIWLNFGLSARPSFWWFDNLTHFLGGVMVASLFFSFFNNRPANWIVVISFVALIGLSWEFYEYLNDRFWLTNTMELNDTLSDLFFDLLGGGLAAAIYYSKFNLYKD